MTHRKRSPLPTEDSPGLDISSLIDVCFLLLIYFLVTTQIVKKEQELSSTLPVPNPTGTPVENPPLNLLIEENGNISIRTEAKLIELVESDKNSRELPTLSKRLALHKSIAQASKQNAVVTIKVDGSAKQQRVTDVLNALAGAKISEITFLESS